MVGRTGGAFLVLTMVTAMAGCSGDGEAPRGAGNGAQLAALFDHEWDWRLRAFPRYTEENIGLLREGLRTGVTIPRASLAGIETTVAPLA